MLLQEKVGDDFGIFFWGSSPGTQTFFSLETAREREGERHREREKTHKVAHSHKREVMAANRHCPHRHWSSSSQKDGDFTFFFLERYNDDDDDDDVEMINISFVDNSHVTFPANLHRAAYPTNLTKLAAPPHTNTCAAVVSLPSNVLFRHRLVVIHINVQFSFLPYGRCSVTRNTFAAGE